MSERSSGGPDHKRPPNNLRYKWSVFSFVGLTGLVGLSYLLSQPRWIFSVAAQVWPGAYYAVDLPVSAKGDRPKVIALSIDDGPSSETARILDTLDRYDAKATFFNISGNLPTYEGTVRQAVATGHEFGNHLTADEPSIRLSAEAFEADLLAAEEAILPLLPGDASVESSGLVWLRPGMGFYNSQMVSTARSHGYQLVLGSVFPYDTHIPSVGFASAFILRTVEPGDIIVLHDGEGRGGRTVDTLERVLPVLRSRGYEVTTISGLFERVTAGDTAGVLNN
ncbi:MAG: chitin deacetylase family protein [Cyanobacteria bacterium J06606_4]